MLAQFVISLAVLEQLINYLFWLKSCQAIYWRKHIRRTSERRVTLIFVSCEKWTIFNAVLTNTRSKREGLSQSGFCWPMRCCKRHIWHNADCSRTAQPFQDVQSEVYSACYIDMYFTSSHSPLQGLPFNTYFILQQCDFDHCNFFLSDTKKIPVILNQSKNLNVFTAVSTLWIRQQRNETVMDHFYYSIMCSGL